MRVKNYDKQRYAWRKNTQGRGLIETIGAGGGLLLAPTHMVEPDVPWENIQAFVDAVKEYGKL